MNLDVRRFLVPVVIFVIGMALFTLMALLGVAFGLPTATAQGLAFGGLVAYFVVIVIVVRTRRR
jgi:hypothetical protein